MGVEVGSWEEFSSLYAFAFRKQERSSLLFYDRFDSCSSSLTGTNLVFSLGDWCDGLPCQFDQFDRFASEMRYLIG